MNVSIPAQVSEIVNGTLTALFAVSTLFFVSYLARAWRERDYSLGATFYTYENKTALALLTTFVGMGVKTGAAWWAIHLYTHQQPTSYPLLTSGIIGGTMLSVWGVICLIRALSREDWSRGTWVWIAAGSFAFGLLFALL
jgi:hypothetical protein